MTAIIDDTSLLILSHKKNDNTILVKTTIFWENNATEKATSK